MTVFFVPATCLAYQVITLLGPARSAARGGRDSRCSTAGRTRKPSAASSCRVLRISYVARLRPAFRRSTAACQAAVERPKAGGRRSKLKRADVPDGNVQRQVWRGGSREGSGRDASVLLMLQRDCMVSMPAIRASQPSPTRALVHSQQVALTRAQDAAAELELSCGPSTAQLEAAEDQRLDGLLARKKSCHKA